MAAPMWTGGPDQFQDVNPWIWAIMDDWKKAPFYPTDPPRDPGAFADSVMPLCDFPVLGPFYAYFIVRYVEDYATAWYANPPGTSTSTPVGIDVPGNYAQPYDLPYSNYYLRSVMETHFGDIETSLGYNATVTVHDKLDAIAAAVGAIPEPNPNPATTSDVARILAALYYIAQMVVVPAWAVDNAEVLAAITAAKESIKGPHDTSNSSLWDGMFDPNWGLQRTINDNTNAIETSINNNVDAAEAAILQLLGEGVTAEGGGNFFPGSAGVTFGDPQTISGAALITGPMDGVLVSITATPSGQSTQGAEGNTKYKGLGWLCFRTAEGYGEPKQPLEISLGILKPMTLLQAASAAVYCKPGSSVTITPYTIQAV